jgi:hypothetical protein
MPAWKSSVAVVFGAAALAAGHTGALTAPGAGYKSLSGQVERGFLREASHQASPDAGTTRNAKDTGVPIANAVQSPVAAACFSPSSGSVVGNGAYFPPTLRFIPGAGSLEIAFGIDEGGPVSLEAFDAKGNLVANLLTGEKAAGFHRLSLFSNRLQGKTGQVFFRLRAGGAVLAEMRAASR